VTTPRAAHKKTAPAPAAPPPDPLSIHHAIRALWLICNDSAAGISINVYECFARPGEKTLYGAVLLLHDMPACRFPPVEHPEEGVGDMDAALAELLRVVREHVVDTVTRRHTFAMENVNYVMACVRGPAQAMYAGFARVGPTPARKL